MLLCLLVLLCHRCFVVVGVERCVVVLMCCVVSVLVSCLSGLVVLWGDAITDGSCDVMFCFFSVFFCCECSFVVDVLSMGGSLSVS